MDVIVYVGDYLYRQGPCPEGAVDTASNTTKECSAVNADSHMEEAMASDTILNFVREYTYVQTCHVVKLAELTFPFYFDTFFSSWPLWR